VAGKLANVADSHKEICILRDEAELLVTTSKISEVAVESTDVVDGSTMIEADHILAIDSRVNSYQWLKNALESWLISLWKVVDGSTKLPINRSKFDTQGPRQQVIHQHWKHPGQQVKHDHDDEQDDISVRAALTTSKTLATNVPVSESLK